VGPSKSPGSPGRELGGEIRCRRKNDTDDLIDVEGVIRYYPPQQVFRGVQNGVGVIARDDRGPAYCPYRHGDSVVSDSLLVVIPPANRMERSELLEAAKAVEAGGATSVQLRMKDRPTRELMRAAEALLEVLTIPLYLNDRPDVARAVGAAGVHLGADDVEPDRIRRIMPRPGRVGVSVGSPTEALAVRDVDVDYWSLGPFFATASKADAGSPLGPDGFRVLAALAPPGIPVIAIGGITPDNVTAVIEAGAAGVAVVSGIFDAVDVEAATRAIRRTLDEGRQRPGEFRID